MIDRPKYRAYRILTSVVIAIGVAVVLTGQAPASAAGADVVVTKTGPASVPPGGVIRYSIDIVNNGTATLERAFLNDVSVGLGTPRVVVQPPYLITAGVPCTSFPCDLFFIGPTVRKHFEIEFDVPPCPTDGSTLQFSNTAWVTGVDGVDVSTLKSTIETTLVECPRPATTTSTSTTTSTTSTSTTSTTSTTSSTTTTSTTTIPNATSTTTVTTPPTVATIPPTVLTAPPTIVASSIPSPSSVPSTSSASTTVSTALATTTTGSVAPSTAASPVSVAVQGVELTRIEPTAAIAFTGSHSGGQTAIGFGLIGLGIVSLLLGRSNRKRAHG